MNLPAAARFHPPRRARTYVVALALALAGATLTGACSGSTPIANAPLTTPAVPTAQADTGPGSPTTVSSSAAPPATAPAAQVAATPAATTASSSPVVTTAGASPMASAASPVALSIPSPSPAPQAGGDERLQLVAATYNALQDRFFRPLDSRTLLEAAWEGGRRALAEQRRATRDVPAPQLVGDREADLAQFMTSFGGLLDAAGPGADGTRAAMAASDAMADSVGEQHTVFLQPEQFARFRNSLTTEQGRVGLGVLISGQSAPFSIGGVVPGSPADKAGIKEGDRLERIDGQELSRRELREVSELLRGEAGQSVTLSLRRLEQPVEVAVERARFVEPPLTMRVLPEGVCHFRLTGFPVAFAVGPTGRTVGQELDYYLEQCEQAGGRGWIMDLRGNGGGASLSQVLGRFLDVGPILVERDKMGSRYEQATDGHLFRVQRPLTVLIDGGSASASEAFASAVKEYKRGVVLGQKTAGALNTGNIVPLPLDAGMMVAIREVYSGKDEVVIDEIGVPPDIQINFGRDTASTPRQAIELALEPPAGVGPTAALPRVEGSPLGEAELRRRIEPVQLRAEDADRAEDAQIRGDLPIDTLHYYANDSPSLQAARDRALRLGWLGGLVRWLGGGFPPPYAVDVELYRDADGAHRDFREIYDPGEPRNPPQWRDTEPPVRLGDDTRAMLGTGQNEGRIWIAWRRGNANYVVARNVPPGTAPDFTPLARLARVIDGRAQQTPP